LIVLDANILIRAVLGARTHDLIERYAGKVSFVAPGAAFSDAEKYVPGIHAQRSPSESLFQFRMENSAAVFSRLRNWVAIVPEEKLLAFEDAANQRLRKRDLNDVPILAAALALDCPIWTEDTDFFGVGVATWTTDRVEIYLQSYAAAK
jgi:predicted nucleic acid-binding protein